MVSTFITQSSLERTGAEIISPYIDSFYTRYSNSFPIQRGSRFINPTPCPLCVKYLKGKSCTSCPMDKAFGLRDGRLDNSGCKVWMRKMWGPITFGDYPNFIVHSSMFNAQIHTMHNWLVNIFGLRS